MRYENEFAKMKMLSIWSIYEYSSRCSRSILMTKSLVFKICHLHMFLFSNSKALNDKSIYWELSMYGHFIAVFMRGTTKIVWEDWNIDGIWLQVTCLVSHSY